MKVFTEESFWLFKKVDRLTVALSLTLYEAEIHQQAKSIIMQGEGGWLSHQLGHWEIWVQAKLM